MVPGRITKQKFIDFLNNFSESKTANVIESPSTYQVFGQYLTDDINVDLQDLIYQVKQEIPAHLEFIPAFLVPFLLEMQAEHNADILVTRNIGANDPDHPDYDVFRFMMVDINRITENVPLAERTLNLFLTKAVLEQLLASSTRGIAVTRDTWMNNGGKYSTHKFMDETNPKMDGSWNLDDAGRPDFDVFHVIQMVISRVLSLTPIPVKITSVAITRQLGEQFSPLHNEGVSVNRVATALSQQTLMTGTWALDGSVNLNRSAYPVTVKINGTAV